MEKYVEIIQPVLKKYWIEVGLLTVAILLAIFSLVLAHPTSARQNRPVFTKKTASVKKELVFIDIEGAVAKPGLYKFDSQPRLKDVLEKAGSLSEKADGIYFSKNFNLAKIISDQEKIYIPSIDDVLSGPNLSNVYPSGQLALDSNQDNTHVGINTASLDELDTLPGIGQVTAQKIIDNRPYQSIDELSQKKIVKSNVYEQIKNIVTID